jgi:hypothetical protein
MVRRAKVPPVDITFVKVQDALEKPGCPICRVSTDVTRRFLWTYLYERVNDPPSRRELLASRGFCARHGWALREQRDALGVAILYRHLLQELTCDISRTTSVRPVRRRRGQSPAGTLRTALRPTTECPACAHVKEIEDIAIRALVGRLEISDVLDRLSDRSGLCLPHFLAALAVADPPAAGRLVQAELRMLETVVHDLDEFIRKHDYRFSKEGLTPEQGQSWTRAIELLVGADPLADRGPAGPWVR